MASSSTPVTLSSTLRYLSCVCFKKKSKLKVTKKDQKSKQHKAHVVDAVASKGDKEGFNTSHNHVHQTGCHGCTKKLTTMFVLNNVEIQMEIDTGAELST